MGLENPLYLCYNPLMAQFDFDFHLKPKRPLWKEVVTFCVTVLSVWGGTHLVLNYGAFAQIAEYKFENLKTSVVDVFTEEPVDAMPMKLDKVEKKVDVVFRNKALKPQNQAKKTFEEMEVYPSDNRIYIEKIDKNIPLVNVPNHKNWQELERRIQEGLRGGVVVHPISRAPGRNGNFFLTGHSSYYAWAQGRFKDVFALLHEVEVGDRIEVYWEGKKYVYIIQTKGIVEPTEVSILNQPRDRSIITLMTCTPIGTNKQRLVLVGELVKE